MKSIAIVCCSILFGLNAGLRQDPISAQVSPQRLDSTARVLLAGESHSFRVDSRKFFNDSGTCLVAGACYTFHVNACDNWKDLQIVTDANGWTSGQAPFGTRRLVRRMESRRRCPTANWFELVGTVGKNECNHFRIGCGGIEKVYSPKVSGQFFAFANDLSTKYYNNSGSLCVTITRVK